MAGDPATLERTQLVLLLETFTRRVKLALGEETEGEAAAAEAAAAAADGAGARSSSSSSSARLLLPSALDTPAVRALLSGDGGGDDPASATTAEAYFDGLRARVAAALQQAAAASATGNNDTGRDSHGDNTAAAAAAAAAALLPVLCAGVRCLRAFVALAVTGPARSGVPSAWVDALAATDPATGTLAGARGVPPPAAAATATAAAATAPAAASGAGLGRDSATPAERWVAERLREDGEDLETRVPHLDLLLAARECLLAPWPRDGAAAADAAADAAAAARGTVDARLPTWHWWVLRAASLHQQVLSGRAASLHALAARSGAAAAAWARALPQQQQQQPLPPPPPPPSPAAARFLAALPCLPPSTAALLCACAHLELAAAAHLEYGYGDLAQAALRRAAGALGVEVAVVGALGRRTVHQRDAKAQLVARVRGGGGGGSGGAEDPSSAPPPSLDADMAALGLESLIGSARETEGVREDGAVFLAPRLVLEDDDGEGHEGEAGGALPCPPPPGAGPGAAERKQQASRHPAVEQALLLAWARLVLGAGRGRAEDELSGWEASPYVEAVLREPRSQPALQLSARLLKARHEAGRGRTRERALITLEALADYSAGAPGAVSALARDTDAAAAEAAEAAASPAASAAASAAAAAAAATASRLPYSFTARQCLLPTLQKELAAAYVALGLPGPALELYERLEAWDALIICYRLLGKCAAARELILRRLEAMPEDPSLWCALGDLAEEGGGAGGDRHYEEAWRRSRGRSARAKRSLARSALRRRDYAGAAAHYEDALALSPMHAQAWFSLGYCRLREAGDVGEGAGEGESDEEAAAAASAGNKSQRAATTSAEAVRLAPALRAFSRVTLLDPQHGEAWANLAALWLRAGRPREALSAAQQAVRHKRESWQAWENYAAAALRAGEPVKAARALREVLALTKGERLPGQLAEGLVEAVEGAVARARGGEEEAEEEQGGEAEDADSDDEFADDATPVAAQDPVAATEALLSLLRLTHGEERGEEEAAAAATTTAAGGAATNGGRARDYDGTEASAAVRGRQRAQLLDATSSFLRDASLAPACAAATWALVARVKLLRGEQGGAREAWVKACRGLAADGAFRTEAGAFAALAEASARYGLSCARAYRDAREQSAEAAVAAAGSPSPSPPLPPQMAAAARDLAACRMHLRSVMRQCEERFAGREQGYADMAAALDEVAGLEEDAKARRAAAAAAARED